MNTAFWLGAMVLFLVVEAITPMLVSIWFALGALAGGICAYLGMSDTGCVLVFAVVSAAAIILFKKFYAGKISKTRHATNADRWIGAVGVVTEEIDPIKGKGVVEVGGNLWSAKANETIKVGTLITVSAIEGVKLVVEERKDSVCRS